MIYGIRESSSWASEVRLYQPCPVSITFTTSDINEAYQYLAYLILAYPPKNWPGVNHHVEERSS